MVTHPSENALAHLALLDYRKTRTIETHRNAQKNRETNVTATDVHWQLIFSRPRVRIFNVIVFL